jgi:hypothetical protein
MGWLRAWVISCRAFEGASTGKSTSARLLTKVDVFGLLQRFSPCAMTAALRKPMLAIRLHPLDPGRRRQLVGLRLAITYGHNHFERLPASWASPGKTVTRHRGNDAAPSYTSGPVDLASARSRAARAIGECSK